ncbi:MAG: hypothetical protein ACI9P5_004037 [Saprospiraceae bacterium]|jgi:hypothetical protein|tara:strand:+ start:3336 stop:4640 length:1305 start_codon:yes stop_codon:yes gene_type:complete
MKTLVTVFYTLLFTFITLSIINAQNNVGVATTSPDAPFHVSSSGQVLTPGGLMLLGDRSELHLELDFNRIQSLATAQANPTALLLQPDGGNIGIGISNPLSHLHISGISDQLLTLHKTSIGGGKVGIDLLRDNEFGGTDWRIVNDGGKLQFLDATNNFTGAADLNMTINQGGNVGIGIENANSKLHVVGTEAVGETGDGFFQVGDPSGQHLRFDGNEILARNNDSPSMLYFQYWSGNLSLCQNDLGRVGIGTASPTAKLHITDGGDVSLAGGGELVLGSSSSTNIAMDGNEIQARNNGLASPMYIQAGGGDVLLTPYENGQVGIGITSAANMPSDDYLLAVDGKIISEEVRAEVSGSWPDYVFKDDYKLTPLNILEQEIKEKGHLPNIPSAEEVEQNGFELGDMQKRMMEKVEELTLYVIELKKEIEALKKVEN